MRELLKVVPCKLLKLFRINPRMYLDRQHSIDLAHAPSNDEDVPSIHQERQHAAVSAWNGLGRAEEPALSSDALLLATLTPLTFLGRKLSAVCPFPAMIVLPHPLGMGNSPCLEHPPHAGCAVERKPILHRAIR